MKRIITICIVIFMLLVLCSCTKNNTMDSEDDVKLTGSVRYMNSDPNLFDAWTKIADAYTAESGVPVEIVPLENDVYFESLVESLNSDAAPTLFDIRSINEFKALSEYCYDLTGSKVLNQVITNAFTLNKDCKWEGENNFAAVGYSLNSYGIIYNKSVLEQVGIRSRDIRSFTSLKNAVVSLQERKDELGLSSVFAPVLSDIGDPWIDFSSYINDVCAFSVIKQQGYDNIDLSSVDYSPASNLTDLIESTGSFTHNPTDVEGFIQGRYAFCVGPIDLYSKSMGDAIGYENVGILPLYTGVRDEDEQGLNTNANRFWAVNNGASDEDRAAALDFLSWIAENDFSNNVLELEMGIHTPFANSTISTNPLVAAMIESLATRKNPIIKCLTVSEN